MKMMQHSKEQLNKMSQEELINEVLELQKISNALLETIESNKRKMYGKKSEQIPDGQLSLFNEIEDIAAETETVEVKGYTKNKKKKTGPNIHDNLEGLEVKETVVHSIEEAVCPECGSTMEKIGTEVKYEVVYKPAELYKVKHVFDVYKCSRCYSEDDTFEAVTAEDGKINRVIKGSEVGASVISGIIYNKFVMDVPLYRQEKDYLRKGIQLSRQTMSNWAIKCSDAYLERVYQKMKEDLNELKIVNADETTLKVIEEHDREKSYMWLVMSGKYEEKQMAIYHYNHSREYSTLGDIIGPDKTRYIHSDGYGAYKNDEYGKDVACMAHIRRKFYDALTSNPLHGYMTGIKDPIMFNKALRDNPGYGNIWEVIRLIDQLYIIEKKFAGKTSEEIYEIKQAESKAALVKLYEKITSLSSAYQTKGKMGTAINYALERKPYMENYLLDGRLELDNNRAERQIKPFVIGRKNWLFSNTNKGAKVSSIYYSLVESAKMNELDPFEYMTYLLEELSGKEYSDERIENILPYSDKLPERLYVKSHNK